MSQCRIISLHVFLGIFPYDDIDIHQLNLILEVLGTPNDEFIQKITSESVSSFSEMLNFIKLFFSIQLVNLKSLSGSQLYKISSPMSKKRPTAIFRRC